jgi:hypothetical protein
MRDINKVNGPKIDMGPLLEDKYAVIVDGVIYAECTSDDIAYDLATKKSDELLQLGELTSTVYVARIYLERRIFNLSPCPFCGNYRYLLRNNNKIVLACKCGSYLYQQPEETITQLLNRANLDIERVKVCLHEKD